jgi:eukaryotic-like serine/threonine-protein kinase
MIGSENPPRDTEEGRALLQSRLATFGWVGMWMSAVFLGIGFAVTFGLGLPGGHATAGAEGAGLVVGGALWLLTRRGTRKPSTLLAMDVGVTLVQCGIFTAFGYAIPITGRPELVQLFCVANILGLRAFLIPSTSLRTGLIGGAAFAGVVASAYQRYSTEALPPGLPGAAAYTIIAAVFASSSLFITVLTSRTIFGLREKVREAMQVGQYTLLERIGAGGMGVVYRATHALLKRPTAVKLLPPDRAGEHDIQRFEREVQLTAALTHPNTVSIFDYGRTADGVFYYAMEFLDGVDLQTLVELDGPQDPSRVVHVLKQVAGALTEAHALGLIHRDLKPANVLVCTRGGVRDVAKIVDFGLAKSIKSVDPTQSNVDQIIGTPLYMSPEAISNPLRVGAPSDMYGVGAIAYQLLSGQPPFLGATAVEICGHHLHTAPVPPFTRLGKEGPKDLEALVLDCLAKSPADRPDVRRFAERLSALGAVPPWTEERASAWWAARADAIRERRKQDKPVSSEVTKTFAVDLERRAGVPA